MPEGKISQELREAMRQSNGHFQVVVELESPSSAAADNARRVQLGVLFCTNGDGVTVNSATVFTGAIDTTGIERLERRKDVVGISFCHEAHKLG